MREILFRGKDEGTKKWVQGCYLEGATRHCITCSLAYYPRYDVIPETVGQYTGLTDANGMKIFEGDIHCNENNNKKFVVKFGHFYDRELLDDMYGWYMEDNKGNRFGLNGSECEYANIIGNIHDNPELLKSE